MQCELRAKRGRAGRYAMMGVIASVRATWESDFKRYPAVRPWFHDLGFAQAVARWDGRGGAEPPNGLTSRVVTFGSPACSAGLFHIAPIAALPFTMPDPGGNAVASSV